VLFPGTSLGIPAYTVKVHAKFPAEHPAIRGIVCVHESATGKLLAVMDSTYLTAIRTGIAGAIGADVLARKEADTAAVIGAGVQGEYQLRALASLRTLRRVWVYDIASERARAFAQTISNELRVPIESVSSVERAARSADILLVATWARAPFIVCGMLTSGAHVTTLGADEPGKAEVSAELVEAALFVCDDRRLAVETGAVGNVGLGAEAVDAEIGEVLGDVHPGRTSAEELTIYAGVGLPFQDTIAAWHVYQAAKARRIGTEMDFLA
jgi:ornithine cyclodeaminase